MTDFDKVLYFTCPDECGQLAVPCSLRMVLNNETFFCEACGCEFQAALCPDWFARATGLSNEDPQLFEMIVSLYNYLYANGHCLSEDMIGKLLENDSDLWELFPPEKLSASDILRLLEDPLFASRFSFSKLTGTKTVDLLLLRPELADKCRMSKVTAKGWLRLIQKHNQLISQCPADFAWDKLNQADWDRVLSGKHNGYIKSLYNVLHGKKIAVTLKKFPELKKYIKWESIQAGEWLKLLTDLPEYAVQCPWNKIVEYIETLPADQMNSMESLYPNLWKRRNELIPHIDFPKLQKLPGDKYYTILDFFDWEDRCDFSSLSSAERVTLFSKFPRLGKRFGWNRLSSEERLVLATHSLEFCRDYGWENFSEAEILYILREKPDYRQYIDFSRFKRSSLRRLANYDEEFAEYYKLGITDFLMFRRFESKKLSSRITFYWHSILSILVFAAFWYFMYDGPCGFKSLWTESRGNAVSAAVFYWSLAAAWSWFHSWLFSGRTPFLSTILTAVTGGIVAAVQFGYTFFLSKISLSNYISLGVLLVWLLILIMIKNRDQDCEVCRSNRDGFVKSIFYAGIFLLTVIVCQPCFHWQFLRVNSQLSSSARPFQSAAQYYLKKAFVSDSDTQRIISELELSFQHSDYDRCRTLFEKIPSLYSSLPEVRKLEDQLQNIGKSQLTGKYTEDSIAAYDKKDYSKLYSVIYKADLKNAEIQFLLGEFNRFGYGGHKIDFKEAAEWYQKAVAQDHAKAMCALADLYMEGKGVKKSAKKAAALYRTSADKGLAAAQKNLAILYRNGIGVRKNQTMAYNLYLKAAKQNDAVAQRQVALMLYLELGARRNNEEIDKWLNKAAEQNDAVAQSFLGSFYLSGTLGIKNEKLAVSFLIKASEQGDTYAQGLLGFCYATGKGVDIDGEKAVKWLNKAAEKNDAAAQYVLFELYYTGKVVDSNSEKALYWLLKSAKGNNPAAQYTLGMCYWIGDLVKEDLKLALFWLKKSESNKYPKAKEALKHIKAEMESR